MEDNINLETFAAETTDFYADSIEWCPISPHFEYFLTGTYQLDDDKSIDGSTQVRQGNISLYRLLASDEHGKSFPLRQVEAFNTSGVLDMKWCPVHVNETCTFAGAFSCGSIKLFQMKLEETGQNIIEISNHNLNNEENMIALSLDWSCWKNQSSPYGIIVSDSCGHLNYIQLTNSKLCPVSCWKAHQFESWIATFDYDEPQIIFSGGDDCYFKAWDRRSLSSPIFSSKRHTMGVTSISKSKKEHVLATGSYDECIFLWDTRQMKIPLSEISVGGGVWRLKWHPTYTDYLLSASMHNGFHILQVKNNGSESEIIAEYKKHTSLAYGTDWCYLPQIKNLSTEDGTECELFNKLVQCNFNSIVASCSFYDKSLNVWGVKLNKL